MSNTVKTKFGGIEYAVPHLPIAVMKVVVPIVYAMRKVEAEGGNTMEAMLEVVECGLGHIAGVTREQIEQMNVTMEELRDMVATITVQAGMRMANDSEAILKEIKEGEEGGVPLAEPTTNLPTSTE